jgi:signal transduction histidine kinase
LESVFSRYAGALQAVRNTFDYKSTLPVGNTIVEIRISPVVNRRGQRQGRLFVFRDVTARVQFEQAQRDEKALADTMREIGSTLNSTLDTSRVLSLILDSAERLVPLSHANIMLIEGETTRIRQHRGYSPEAAASLDTMAFDYHDYATLTRAATSGAPVIVSDTAQDPDWKVIETLEDVRSFACMPIQGEAELAGFITLDSTSAGMFKPEMVNRLQIFAQQAAAAIKNARLYEQTRRQTDELEALYARVSRLETLKSEMIRVAAHDLKNPLSVIISSLEFLTTPDMKPDRDKMYTLMKTSSQRMNQIIQDFLSLDRIERIADLQTMEPFDLRDLLSKAVDEYAGTASQKAQALAATLPDEACVVRGDAVQVYEAVANFISNAIKYTPDAGRITVSLGRRNGSAHVEVVDSGYGIPEDQQAQLFQPFYRAETEETQQIAGTGLGLHLAKNIIERQGGTLVFHSIYGKGSTFGFELPVYQPEETVKTPPPDLFAEGA